MAINPRLAQGKNGTKSVEAALKDAITMDSFTVATVPAASAYTGQLIHVSNGAGGAPCLAYSDGTNWLRILIGAAVNASV